MTSIIEQFKIWFSNGNGNHLAQSVGLESDVQDADQRSLPPAIAQSLKHSIRQLHSPSPHVQSVQSTLESALKRWRENLDAPNCLVVLGTPVEPVARLLREVLDAEDRQILNMVKLQHQWTARPHDYHDIYDQLVQGIEASPSGSTPSQTNGAESPNDLPPKALAVIPCLDWCFLRCVDGLNGVDYLRESVLRDRSRFWLIGCNRWAWKYLDHIHQISAYFEQTLSLQPLNSLDLKTWLMPAASEIKLKEGKGDQRNPVDSVTPDESSEELEAWSSIDEKRYFDSLANTTSGLSSVAAQLWLRSLQLPSQDADESDESDDSNSHESDESNSATTQTDSPQAQNGSDSPKPVVRRKKASLPSLPKLTADDRYLLFSLLLHGGMSLPHLSLSLGDDDGKVRAHVQMLQRAGVIERSPQLLEVNPAFYPSLRADLSQNNFLVGDD
ncbi:MAG: hypothetical protein ACFE0J_13075 [Elainellaceae cyanobacterium]